MVWIKIIFILSAIFNFNNSNASPSKLAFQREVKNFDKTFEQLRCPNELTPHVNFDWTIGVSELFCIPKGVKLFSDEHVAEGIESTYKVLNKKVVNVSFSYSLPSKCNLECAKKLYLDMLGPQALTHTHITQKNDDVWIRLKRDAHLIDDNSEFENLRGELSCHVSSPCTFSMSTKGYYQQWIAARDSSFLTKFKRYLEYLLSKV